MDSPSSSDYEHLESSSFELNIDKAQSNYIKTEQSVAQSPVNVNINKVLKEVNGRIMNGYRAGFQDGVEKANDDLYGAGYNDGWSLGFGFGLSVGLILSGAIIAIRNW
jgi:hypothetical protein